MTWRNRMLGLALLPAFGCGPARLWTEIAPSVAVEAPVGDADVRSAVLRAWVAEARGDLIEADRMWAAVVRLDGANPHAWAGRGAFLERVGRRDEAQAAHEHALRRAPEHAVAHLGLARIAIERGDDAGAAPHLARAAASGDAEALALWGRLLLRADEVGRADTVYAQWAALPLRFSGEALERGGLALSVGRTAEAVDDLIVALETFEGGSDAAEILADAAAASCRVGSAWRWAVDARLAERQGAGWRDVAVRIGRFARDPDLLEAALGPEEGLSGALLADRLEVLVHAGRVEEALALVGRARAADPDDASHRLRHAGLLADLDRLDEALALLDTVPLDGRLGAYAAGQRGEVLLRQGDPKAALAAIAPLQPPPWAAVKLQARALAALGEHGRAEQALREHEEVSIAERWRQIAALRLTREDPDSALEALATAGDDPRALADRALLLERLGRPDAASAVWARLAATDPSDPATWRGLARTSEDGLPWLRRAIEADPCDVPARLDLAAHLAPCERVASLEIARDAAPRDRRVLDALATAYHACGASLREAGHDAAEAAGGLRAVEWTLRAIGDEGAADHVRGLFIALEGA